MTTTNERLWNLTEERRNALLDPAEAEFVTHGYDKASLNQILSAAHISKGQAYHYVTGKSDLYLAVCSRKFEPLFQTVEQMLLEPADSKEFWQRVEQLCSVLAGRLANDTALASLARGVYTSAAAAKSLLSLKMRLDKIIDALIEQGQKAEAIRTDLPNGLIRATLTGAMLGMDKWFALNSDVLPPGRFKKTSRGALEMLRNLVAGAE